MKREGQDFSGTQIGIWQVQERITDWRGPTRTLYRVRFACCGRTEEKSHQRVFGALREPPSRCKGCIADAALAAKQPAVARQITLNALEVRSLGERKGQEARERAARIAARRAEWERRTQEAHQWRMSQR